MSEQDLEELLHNLPESNIRPRTKISIVWLVPLVAIFVGSWIAYKAWSEVGSTISIRFKTADGLEAGKTKIKYKNVEIGKITSIHLNHGTGDVRVQAEMVKDVKPLLTDRSRFWVVKARINASGVSGLDTLLSGAYIGVDPSPEGVQTREYTALEIPPVIIGHKPGKHFTLYTSDLGSIARDAPVYYRKFNVGRVEEVSLEADGQSVKIRIFINAPYDQWVNASSKFWNASGMDFSMSANGVNVDTESLVSILIGGIAFESSNLSTEISQATNNAEFDLYPNRAETLKNNYKTATQFVIHFSESVRGLEVGAPVEFKGIQVGKVTNIQLVFDTQNNKINVPVTIVIDYDKIAFKGQSQSTDQLTVQRKKQTDFFINQGLRAQLETGSLLTGQLFIALDFAHGAKPVQIDWSAKIPEFPSVPGTFGAFKKNINGILKKVDSMMTQVNELSYKLNHNLEPELSSTLKQAENTLLTIEGTFRQADHTLLTVDDSLNQDSVLQQDLQIALREFAKAARSVKTLTDYLERHPESLIQGKTGDQP